MIDSKHSFSAKLRKLPTLAFTGALALAGCLTPPEKEAGAPSVGSHQGPAGNPVDSYKALEDMGYTRDQIVETRDGFIVDGDMFFTRPQLEQASTLAKSAQRSSPTVTNPHPSTLRLAIHSSVAAHAAAIHQAVNMWNATKTKLRLEVVTSGQNITIHSDLSPSCPAGMNNLGPTVGGIANLPAGGSPGSAICLNTDNSEFMSSVARRVMIIAHEIGHTIGFRHTNSTDGSHITGTAVTDNQSLMGTSGNISNVLSHNDILAMEILYPSDKPLGGTDLDMDGLDDIVVWRPSLGNWLARTAATGFTSGPVRQWGQRGDMPLEDTDLDGDGLDDLVVWRPLDHTFYVRTSGSGFTDGWGFSHGLIGDIPLANLDIDGDGQDDLVLWRWTDGKFHVKTSGGGFSALTSHSWGTAGDLPVGGIDADKDGKDDLVLWRATDGRFHVKFSATNFTTSSSFLAGIPGDLPVGSTDRDGDGHDDLVVFRPANGNWGARTSGSNLTGTLNLQFGQRGDIPLMGTDIDQDGKRDIIFWRPSTRVFNTRTSGSGFATTVQHLFGI